MFNNLTSPLVDGLHLSIDLSATPSNAAQLEAEYAYLRSALLHYNEQQHDNSYNVSSRSRVCSEIYSPLRDHGGTSCKLSIEQMGNTRFLTLRNCNPVSFLMCQNVLGTCDLRKLALDFFSAIEKAVAVHCSGFEWPPRVARLIQAGTVRVTKLCIAYYSAQLSDSDTVPSFVACMHQIYAAHSSRFGTESLGRMLGFKVTEEGLGDSVSLRFVRYYGTTDRQYSLLLYNKHHETLAKKKRPVLELDNRFRYDLDVSSNYLSSLFKKESAVELADLWSVSEGQGNISEWAKQLLANILDQTKIRFVIDTVPVKLSRFEPEDRYRAAYEKWVDGTLQPSRLTAKCIDYFYAQGIPIREPYKVVAIVWEQLRAIQLGSMSPVHELGLLPNRARLNLIKSAGSQVLLSVIDVPAHSYTPDGQFTGLELEPESDDDQQEQQ